MKLHAPSISQAFHTTARSRIARDLPPCTTNAGAHTSFQHPAMTYATSTCTHMGPNRHHSETKMTIRPFESERLTLPYEITSFDVDPDNTTLDEVMARIRADSRLMRPVSWIAPYENYIKGPLIDLTDPHVARQPLTAIVELLLPEAAKRRHVSLFAGQTVSLLVGDNTSVGRGGANHARDLVSQARAHAVGEPQAVFEGAGVPPSAAHTHAEPNAHAKPDADASPIASAPTHVWLWATPSGNQRPYDATVSAALEGLYLDFGADPHATNPLLYADIAGRRYRIDVARMTQTNRETGYVTQIFRSAPMIDADVDAAVGNANGDAWAVRGGGVVEWSWEAPDGTSVPHDADISLALERLHADFRSDPHRVTPTLITTIGGVAYEFDVEQMTQFDLAGDNEVPIFRTLGGHVPSTPSQSPHTSGASIAVSSASTKTSPCWSWETPSGRLKPYTAEVSASLEEHYLCLTTSPVYYAFIEGREYAINVVRMTQRNTATGKIVRICRNL